MSSSDSEIPTHSAVRRRRSDPSPDEVDDKSRINSSNVKKVHEFRRENIRNYEDPEKDYFEYDA